MLSPKFFHQEFSSSRRRRIVFTENTPNVYIARYLDTWRVDTSLLPFESRLSDTIRYRHCTSLFEHIEKKGVSLEDAFATPTGRAIGFTYNAQWLYDKTNRKGTIRVEYANVQFHLIHMPPIHSIERVNANVAIEEMQQWRRDNGYLVA